MRKLIAIGLVVVLLASLGGVVLAANPATKDGVAYNEAALLGDGEQVIISVDTKVSGMPKDLVIAFTGVSSLTTQVKLKGDAGSTAQAKIEIAAFVDGFITPQGWVVLNDRMIQLTGNLKHLDLLEQDHWIQILEETSSANGFNFFAENVGTGPHTVTIEARRATPTSGFEASATALMGPRTLWVHEVNLK